MVKPKKDRNLHFQDGKWYVDFTAQGKRIRSFGGFTKEQARNALAKLRIEKLDEKLGFKKLEAEPIPFEAFADKFLETYCKPNKKSWKGDELTLENLKGFFKGETLRSVGPEMVERFKAERLSEVGPATVNRALACLKTMFNKAVEWGRLEVSPLRTVKKFREPKRSLRILSPDEAQRLLSHASAELRPVLIVALNTGMRRNEILSLRWRNVDFPRGVITLEDTKSGKPRNIPMSRTAYDTLHALPRVSEFVFYNEDTKTHVKDMKTAFHAACRRAKKKADDKEDPGIVGVRFHDLRHTAASWMIEDGIDLVTVSEILGHSSIEMTKRYTHPTPERKRLAVNLLAERLDPTRQKVATVKVPKPVSVSYGTN